MSTNYLIYNWWRDFWKLVTQTKAFCPTSWDISLLMMGHFMFSALTCQPSPQHTPSAGERRLSVKRPMNCEDQHWLGCWDTMFLARHHKHTWHAGIFVTPAFEAHPVRKCMSVSWYTVCVKYAVFMQYSQSVPGHTVYSLWKIIQQFIGINKTTHYFKLITL